MPKTLIVSAQQEVPEFIQLMSKGKGNLILANTEAAVARLAEMYQQAWRRAASGVSDLNTLPFMINGTNYQRTIKRRQIAPTVWEVYSDYATKSGLSVTSLLEAGHSTIDLKDGLLRGPKSRAGKNGRYNIVPFPQGSPEADARRSAAMPMSVYKQFSAEVKAIDAKRKAGASPTPGTSSVSKSGSTTWGTRFDPKSQLGRRSKLVTKKGQRQGTYTWKTGKYAGMVKMQQSTTKSKRGGYMTFRVVSAASDPMSWIVPEQEPWPVRSAVIDFMRPFAEGMLKQALEADIK